jgi:RNA polymerase sigma-70 factor, ECF subfamily
MLAAAREKMGRLYIVSGDTFCGLVEAVAALRDREAFAQIYEYFAPRIHAYFLVSRVEPSAAEDLAHDVMVKVWRHADTYKRDRGSASTWIYGISRNVLTDFRRRKRGEAPLDENALSIPDTIEPADELLNSSQLHGYVHEALSNLPAEQLAMIRLAFFEGLTHKQIAERTGIALGTIKGRIRSALGRLRIALDDAIAARIARKLFDDD